MSYITKEKNTMNKGEKNLITINKAMFAFASTFADAYFADSLNWKKIAIHFKHETSNQRKIITLMSEADSAPFEMSEMARTGNWQIEKIQVFDKDGDMVEVPRSDMPSPSSFDFATVRKIAPSETIVAINEGPQKLVLGSGKGALYEPGFKVRLWNNTLLNFHDSTVYTINTINGDELELDLPVANYVGDPVVTPGPQRFSGNAAGSSYGNGIIFLSFAMSLAQYNSITAGDIVIFTTHPEFNGTVLSKDLYAGGPHYIIYTDNYTLTDNQTTVAGSALTINEAGTTTPGTLKDLSLKFPSFADASPKQKGVYQFIGSTF